MLCIKTGQFWIETLYDDLYFDTNDQKKCTPHTYRHTNVHHLIISDNLYSDILLSFKSIPGPHHVTEHTWPSEPKHSVAAIQLFTNPNTYGQELQHNS